MPGKHKHMGKLELNRAVEVVNVYMQMLACNRGMTSAEAYNIIRKTYPICRKTLYNYLNDKRVNPAIPKKNPPVFARRK